MEADTLGFKLTARAGFSVDCAITAWEKNKALDDAVINMMSKNTNCCIIHWCQHWSRYLVFKFSRLLDEHPCWEKRVENLECIRMSM